MLYVTKKCVVALPFVFGMGACSGFVFPATSLSQMTGKLYPSTLNSYLDSLSSQSDDGDEDPRFKQPPPVQPTKQSGVIPSGRGPLGSYLDTMNAADKSMPFAQNDEATSNGNEEVKPIEDARKKPTKWSGAYLSSFLTSDDDSRTDIRNLLTQRSIQSFMRLLEECRDPHSAKWISEDFLNTGNLLDYHGSGARFIEDFGGRWDAPLVAMTEQPRDRIIVSSKRRGRGHGGWSKNNPYLEERWVEMAIDIDPSNLASRILQVREQIAVEWQKDLDILSAANDQIINSFYETTRERRETDSNRLGEAVDCQINVFERTAGNMMNENSRFAVAISSPFRRSNFDLLYNLCTQAAIHRILRDKQTNEGAKDASFLFLRDFYTARAEEFFDGDLQFGRADDFMDELLQTSPSLTNIGLVDPVGVAESIILMRKEVARDWKVLMIQVPSDHTGIRQALFSNQIKGNPAEHDDIDITGFQ